MYPYIKNLTHKKVLKLSEQIQILNGQVVSKTISQNDYISITLFGFDKGEEIAAHDSTGDALVYVIEGKGKFVVDGKVYEPCAGDMLVMPANIPHSLHAVEKLKILLIVVFGVD